MTADFDETITVAKTIREDVYDGPRVVGQITGDSRVDEQGRWVAELGLIEASGNRDIDVVEGDTLEFAGGKWQVTKVYEPTASARGSVAQLTRINSNS